MCICDGLHQGPYAMTSVPMNTLTRHTRRRNSSCIKIGVYCVEQSATIPYISNAKINHPSHESICNRCRCYTIIVTINYLYNITYS